MRVVQSAELLRLDCEPGKEDSEIDTLGNLIYQAYSLTLKLCRLESRSIVQICLLMVHISQHLFFELAEVRCFDFLTEQVQILEDLSVEEKDSFSYQVFALCILTVANELLYVP